MKEERPNWSPKSAKAMRDGKEEFVELQFDLLNLMVKFSLRALKTFNASSEKDELNPLQINNIVAHEIESVIVDLHRPDVTELIRKKAEQDFYSGTSEPLKPSA